MSELIHALTRSVIDLTARVRVLESALSGASPLNYVAARDIPKVRQLLMDASLLFGLPVEVILSKTRVQNVAHARQWVMYEAAAFGISTPRIGRDLGGLDHTTVMYGIKREHGRRLVGKPMMPLEKAE